MRSNRKNHLFIVLLLNPLGATLAQLLECPFGWGVNAKLIQIPPDQINDGYCDCPISGLDETETNACSGSTQWPGIHANTASTLKFHCPGQPQLQIAVSKVQDGICDCCSGADEAQGVCQDICDEVLAAERQEAERRLHAFREGSLIRKKELASYSKLREKTARDLEVERGYVTSLESRLNDAKDQLTQWKIKRLEQRLVQVKERTAKIATDPEIGILNGLSTDELSWMIVHACQTAGEMQAMFPLEEKDAKFSGNSKDTDSTTCVPLRLAGLDAGLIWESTTYKPKFMNEAVDKILLAELLDFNLQHIDSPVWTQKTLDKGSTHSSKLQRRRLTEVDPENEEGEDLDDNDADSKPRRDPSRDSSKHAKKYEQEERRLQLEQLILGQPFSLSRVALRQKAEKVISLIDAMKETAEGGANMTEDAEETGNSDPGPMIDPVPLPFIRNKLDDRRRVIQTGLDYAVSAKVLMDELEASNPPDFRAVLQSLLIGTLIHENLSFLQFWELLANVVPELQTADEDSKICKIHITCPPSTIRRNSVAIPSMEILKAVEEACIGLLQHAQQSCVVEDKEDALPGDIPNGYGGFYVLNGRDEIDLFHAILGDLTLVDNDETKHERDELSASISTLETELENLQSKISDMVDLVDGGNDGSYGPDGELYSMKNSCHSIDSGKYTYKLCLNDSATQSEGGSGGTNLGKWDGASVDNDGTRVWKWTNGAKCWNGPKRSATVRVTCGIENQIISADEPETCRYVFEMESPIACDESYRLKYGLPTLE
ncbi:protein kinase C substrate 80K-H [Fistulifera solaris]|uniref:Glucosidase 2 subunit beta n=1 Tax=Fistulifera solaris TaxID=1519565 RepID=A0A1Z5JAG4_FISSO|nr:protein kinase C substrate 80K-H [Fistulifera solaris]|eukprot:GAX10980.1 protein kinase C substrate 80K-H [Fistulifera solaris]